MLFLSDGEHKRIELLIRDYEGENKELIEQGYKFWTLSELQKKRFIRDLSKTPGADSKPVIRAHFREVEQMFLDFLKSEEVDG